MNEKQQIHGYIERITFANAENGYTIARIQEPKKKKPTTVVGRLPGVNPGETIRCEGEWKMHLIHGKQFEVSSFRVEAPADVEGIRKYLGSGLIPGIGPVYAKRIVEAFGAATLDIIDEDPDRLREVSGLGEKRLGSIIASWSEQRSVRDVMIFLQSNGVSPAYAQKIYRAYGNKSIAKVKENPYRLAEEVFGIGFKKADAIAQTMGVAVDSPERINAGIQFVLLELSGEGHVCYPFPEFMIRAAEILNVSGKLVEERAMAQHQEGTVVLESDFIWMRRLYRSEMGIAHEIARLKKAPSRLRDIDLDKAVEWVQQKLNLTLAENQKRAVMRALSDKMHIITGGPGTGKSTITNAILAVTSKLTGDICLAAPTGRAAKRMSEITGRKAQTIHSLLEVDFKSGGFKRGRDNPLPCNLIIVDEASMIDTGLMYSLLKAIPDDARVIFVGDIYQLPSVGPGNVLKDIIQSTAVSVTTLNEIYRQAAGSQIITNAHRINKGVFPDITPQPYGDFFFIEAKEPEQVLENILTLVSKRLPARYKFDPIEDIQVLAPMRKGVVGIDNLNEALQKQLNPRSAKIQPGGRRLLVGDKVMQTRNNYQKNVFNGDVGRVKNITEKEVTITFDDRDILYTFSELDEVALAYAVSIHKYQGSETPCVVIPVHTTHFKLLCRNLLYTGVTRGKQIVVLVGTKKALAIAVKNDEVQQRHTGLLAAIQEKTLKMPL